MSEKKSKKRKERVHIDPEKFKKLWCKGYTINELAVIFNTSRETIKYRAQDFGLSRPKKKIDNRLCETCRYGSYIGSGVGSIKFCCGFIDITGKRRGCDSGPSCKRYIKGPRIESRAEKEYRESTILHMPYEYEYINFSRRW